MGRVKCFERSEILEKAIQIFWKKGFADTSLSDLEKATGVNKSGLYSEFKDKEDLFFESLKFYRDSHPILEILKTEPLGRKNIENYLKAGMNCKGQKGCFLANTMREYSIIPDKVRRLLEQNASTIREDLLLNIKASGIKKNPEHLADLIITFSMGLSLKLNALRPEQIEDEIMIFLQLIK